MQQDILVHRLFMRVEPTDASYMPSLVVVSGGETVHSLKEIRTISIGSSDTLVSLIQDSPDVSFRVSDDIWCLTHSLIHHFEAVPNSKKLQTTTKMWLLKDFKIEIAWKTLWKRGNHSFFPQCFPKAFFFNLLKGVYMEEMVNSLPNSLNF